MNPRNLTFSILSIAVLILCWQPVSSAVALGFHDDRYVQIIAGPLLCAFLMYWERKRIFRNVACSAAVGVPALLFAVSLAISVGSDSRRLGLAVLAVVVALTSAFILCYGLRSFRAAGFALACLLLTIPVPAVVMDSLTTALQHASAATSYWMLRLVGVPVFAEGMRMSLPNLEIEVAPECSGIRSCLALALVGLLGGRLFLRYGWSQLALVVSTIPIAIFKNAIRISVVAALSAYVNHAFLYGPIHRYGGLVFTPLGFALFVAVLAGLRRAEVSVEKRHEAARPIPEAAPAATV